MAQEATVKHIQSKASDIDTRHSDIDSLLRHALAKVQGLRALAGEVDDDQFEHLTGWQLNQLLEPVERDITEAINR